MEEYTLTISRSANHEGDGLTLKLEDQKGDYELQRREGKDLSTSEWTAALNTRGYVERQEDAKKSSSEAMKEVGQAIGKLMGEKILRKLSSAQKPITLHVQLEPGEPNLEPKLLNDPKLLANVPWEIALWGGSEKTLFQDNVIVRIALTQHAEPKRVEFAKTDPQRPLRILLCYPDPPNPKPLALRLEREKLIRTIRESVQGKRDVEVIVLCHGVTLKRLKKILLDREIDIIHWSSHGKYNVLQIEKENPGDPDYITGEDIISTFSTAVRNVPSLIFLSACHSAVVYPVLLEKKDDGITGSNASRRDLDRDSIHFPTTERVFEHVREHLGAAVDLLRARVPQVVAMRYAVGDVYARRLACKFYENLLSATDAPSVERALQMSRKDLVDDVENFHKMDPFTPVVFGASALTFLPIHRASKQPKERAAKLSGISPPEYFVGRNDALTRIHNIFNDVEVQSRVIVIDGPEAIGKTALVAEAMWLWNEKSRFDDVIRVDCEGMNAIKPVLDRIHAKIGINDSGKFDAESLIGSLMHTRTLLVLDDISALFGVPASGNDFNPEDTQSSHLFSELCSKLDKGNSRVLITTKNWPHVLSDREDVVRISLGALKDEDVVVFFEYVEELRALRFGGESKLETLRRVIRVAEGLPARLQRIAKIAKECSDPRDSNVVQAAVEAELDRVARVAVLPPVDSRPASVAPVRPTDGVTSVPVDLLPLKPAAPPVLVFLAYATEDEDLRTKLVTHLAKLVRDGIVSVWHDGAIGPGEPVSTIIAEQLDAAQIVLLLMSADFLASNACNAYLDQALKRRQAGKARLIAILARQCLWESSGLAHQELLPRGGKPVTSWANRDEAWTEVARGIWDAVAELADPELRRPPRAALKSTMVAKPTRLELAKDMTTNVRGSWLEEEPDRFGRIGSIRVGAVVYRMRWIPAGAFLMGSPATEEGRSEIEGPQHDVTLTKGYWLGETPVTQALWNTVMGTNPSKFTGPDHPVDQVSWNNCEAFLRTIEGKAPELKVRLPTEAEWEYACRGGMSGSRYGDLDRIAWYSGTSESTTHAVRGKSANAFGLYDMLGNVWEWCEDWYAPYSEKIAIDPGVANKGKYRILRGGSWDNDAANLRAAVRLAYPPGAGHENFGFRLARSQVDS